MFSIKMMDKLDHARRNVLFYQVLICCLYCVLQEDEEDNFVLTAMIEAVEAGDLRRDEGAPGHG